MAFTSRSSICSSGRWRRAAGRLAVLGLLEMLSTCSVADLGDVPFRCSRAAPDCPPGYHCNSQQCVRDGARLPVFLTSTIDDGEASFSLHTRPRGDVVVCWRQALSTREPGVYGAILDARATVVTPATPLYTADSNSIALLTPVAGDCAQRGDLTVVLTARLSGTETYLRRLFEFNFDTSGSANLFNEEFHRHEFNTFTLTEVGNEVWSIDAFNGGIKDDRRVFTRSIVTDARIDTRRLDLPPTAPDRTIVSTESYGGNDGMWFYVLFSNNEIELAWIDRDATATAFIDPPRTGYRQARVLGVRGSQLAVIYQLDETTWQVYWVSPATGGPDDPSHRHAPATPGPTMTLPVDVRRPGGLVDGDRLLVAGATDVDNVAIWAIPWGGRDPLQPPIESIHKFSRIIPRRLALAHTSGYALVMWTERISESIAGYTAYSALYASGTQLAITR